MTRGEGIVYVYTNVFLKSFCKGIYDIRYSYLMEIICKQTYLIHR